MPVAPTLSENTRTTLIGQIAAVLNEPAVPAETRAAGLALIGWLARRMPHDRAPACCAAVVARSRAALRVHAPGRRAR
jgi:hypothetical protein